LSDSWKITLPCTRAEAENMDNVADSLAGLEPKPAVIASEVDETRPDEWLLEVYFSERPDAAIVASVAALAPSAAGQEPAIEKLADEDWVAISQQGLEPIHEGRLFVHTPLHRSEIPAGSIAIEIDAGRAFGTGQHETTAGCLCVIDDLKTRGNEFEAIADIGTGTGVLAFACQRLWPDAQLIASDIDPLAVEIARENAVINSAELGAGPGKLAIFTADGFDHPEIRAIAPCDLLVANILAGPLITLAPAFDAALRPGGIVIVAGLLNHQVDSVAAAFLDQGLAVREQLVRGEWTILSFLKPPRQRAQ
jgi:ribosomal protein L11 methyltransferase